MLRLSGSHFADHLAVCAGIIQLLPELQTNLCEDFTITEETQSSRTFLLLKAPITSIYGD